MLLANVTMNYLAPIWHSLFESPPVSQAPGPVIAALKRCHQGEVQNLSGCNGLARTRGTRAVHIAGGTMKFVPSTCLEQLAGQTAFFEPPESGLPAGLLALPCLVQVTRGTAYVPVVNVRVADVLLYPRTHLGLLSSVQIVSLPTGVSEVRPTIATMSSQTVTTSIQDRIESVDLSALSESEQ